MTQNLEVSSKMSRNMHLYRMKEEQHEKLTMITCV